MQQDWTATSMRLLRDAVAMLAADAESQIRFIGRMSVDELGLDFGTAYPAGRAELLRLPPDVTVQLDWINDRLSALCGTENSDFWTLDALRSDSRWQEIRDAAAGVSNRL